MNNTKKFRYRGKNPPNNLQNSKSTSQDVQRKPKFQCHFSSSSSFSDLSSDIAELPTARTKVITLKNISDEEEYEEEDEEEEVDKIESDKIGSSQDEFHINEEEDANNSKLRLLNKYTDKSRNISMFNLPKQRQYYYIQRSKHFGKKLFTLHLKANDAELARAEFASLFSDVINVSNDRGLVCEIEASPQQYLLRIGNEVCLSIISTPENKIHLDFAETDQFTPPYKVLESSNEVNFDDRPYIPSIKNCQIFNISTEIIAVRKIEKNRLEIDAIYNIYFLSCFALGLYMFLLRK